jgi:hypothetical protein
MRKLRKTLRQLRRIRRMRRFLTRDLTLILFLLFTCLCVFPCFTLWGVTDRTLRDVGILPTRTPTPAPSETPAAFAPQPEPTEVWQP